MARSFVRQGVNIICSNMTISTPRKLGLNPAKEPVETAGITIYSKIPVPLLNISDKKLDACFECKMPLKVWGGLAMFFAGIAAVAVVVLVVATLPISGPIAAAITAASATALTIGTIATVGEVAAASYGIYKTLHECDRVADSQWQEYHKTVFIERENALLDASYIKCPVGGKLNIIIDDAIAQKAARMISDANSSEIYAHWTSKFVNGIITYIATMGLPFGVSVLSGLEIYGTATDSGKSNQGRDIPGDIKTAAKNQGIGTAGDVGNAALKHGTTNVVGSWILDGVIIAQSKGMLTAAHGDAVLNWLVKYGSRFSFKEFATGSLVGLGGTVLGFAVDEYSNEKERKYEQEANTELDLFNTKDESETSKNSIGIISVRND